MKCLVADDAPDILDLVVTVLEGEGWDVVSASDGHEALYLYHRALHENDPFHVLLLDRIMPRLNGIAVGVNVRNLERFGDVQRAKHYYLSGQAEDVLSELTEMAFADGYLMKPFTKEDLLKLLS